MDANTLWQFKVIAAIVAIVFIGLILFLQINRGPHQ